LPDRELKDKSKDSNPTKTLKAGKEPLSKFLLKFNNFSPSILPQSLMNSSEIELKRLLERSRACKVSILQTTGKKLELERPNSDRERLVTDELPELQLTPFQEHGSLVASHNESERLSDLDRFIMVLAWFEDS
jgi:hypothetical protein